jgi:hypothetical protein
MLWWRQQRGREGEAQAGGGGGGGSPSWKGKEAIVPMLLHSWPTCGGERAGLAHHGGGGGEWGGTCHLCTEGRSATNEHCRPPSPPRLGLVWLARPGQWLLGLSLWTRDRERLAVAHVGH